MKKIVFLFLLSIAFSAQVSADDYLLTEMESLYKSLEQDDPARTELNLRLADLYFDVSIQEGSDTSLTEKRERSLELYTNALNGSKNLKKAQGIRAVKVHFQMARVLTKLNERQKALQHFEYVLDNSLAPKEMKSEAATSLAEWFEEKADFKNSHKMYTKAVALCLTQATCNYVYYKRAWLLYKETKLEDAISDMKKSLWVKEGVARTQSLEDYILFLSSRSTLGDDEYNELSSIETKSSIKDLTQKLSAAFYAAGNRDAGSRVLSYINDKNPNMYFEVRLLEENYGFRNWEKVGEYIADLKLRSLKDLPAKEDTAKEVNSILKRFIVQLDAELVKDSNKGIYLKDSIDIFMNLYPKDSMYQKMQQGWLSVEENNIAKIQRLEKWISEELAQTQNYDYIRKLRQTRLSLAQKESKFEIVETEAMNIAKSLAESDPKEAREYEYISYHASYKRKNYKRSLEGFKTLATPMEGVQIDKWSVLAQNLVLDIYNISKNYDGILSQVSSWQNVETKDQSTFTSEVKSMELIKEQAQFAKAVSLGQSLEALTMFYDFCLSGLFEEKSCSNAKVLSVKLKDQQKLVTLLEKAGDEDALVNELERMGRFAKAAKIYEKGLKLDSDETQFLKIAILYEIEKDLDSRGRILSKLISKMKKEKRIKPELEAVIYLTLDQANMIDVSSLSIPWSLTRRISLANRLEIKDSSRKTQKILLSQNDFSGSSWSRLILDKIQEKDRQQKKISFYGRRSQTLFKKRAASIESLSAMANQYLEGADTQTRVYILEILKRAYTEFAAQIIQTPLPEGLDEQTLAQVKIQLETMSAPYLAAGVRFSDLQALQLQNADVVTQAKLNLNIRSSQPKFSSFIESESFDQTTVESVQIADIEKLQLKLNVNPTDTKVLKEFEALYKVNGITRIAAYFTGRINNIERIQ